MNFLHLKYAVEIERTGSISKAAENLFMGQPNLSKAIKELENEIGITVFIRTSKGVTPTEQGKEFLKRARELIGSFKNLTESYNKDNTRSTSFFVAVPRADYIANAFISFASMLDSNEQIALQYEETDNEQIINHIMDFDIGMGIIRLSADNEKKYLKLLVDNDIKYRILWEFDEKLLCGRESILAKSGKVISKSDLEDMTELVFGTVESGKKTIRINDRGSKYDLLTALTDTYMWVSPTPKSVLEQYKLIQLNADTEKKKYKDVLIFRSDYNISRLDEQFLSELERVKEKIRIDKLS